ncbi:hypothetical protein V1260_04850 [Brachybacterium sp. J144]|nr:hypothetical protein [Brachybacterium sp. J144]MEE1650113.1 hypothetical protein [Brachybacterium sp. J144]
MTRFRRPPMVSEWDGHDLWLGALPDGPILRLGGAGALAIELMTADEQRDWSVAELVTRCVLS